MSGVSAAQAALCNMEADQSYQFGGHAVFPSLARDMKRPQDFNKVCNTAFIVATFCYLFMAVIGYLMFGNHVSDEVSERTSEAIIWLTFRADHAGST